MDFCRFIKIKQYSSEAFYHYTKPVKLAKWDTEWMQHLALMAKILPAASARCINVFLSGLSSKFLHPVHLHKLVHKIFAWSQTNSLCQTPTITGF